MKIVNNELLYSLSIQAKENCVARAKYSFQEARETVANKSVNVMDRGCVVPIQTHENGSLTLMVLRGRAKVNFYNMEKEVTDEIFLDPRVGSYGIELQEKRMYNIEILDDNTVVFEVRTDRICAE